jgi:uncharacterized protein (DUF488 family)
VSRPQVYSIGHSSRPIAEFLEILARYHIERLVDVRRFPGSRRHPHFSREGLSRELKAAGIGYTHLGEHLGGFTKTSYEDHMGSEPFARGMKELEALAQNSLTVVMCAEKVPWHCHRQFIARELVNRGWQVMHILDEQTVWDPEQPLLSFPPGVESGAKREEDV